MRVPLTAISFSPVRRLATALTGAAGLGDRKRYSYAGGEAAAENPLAASPTLL